MARRTKAEAQETREHILDAAEQIFHQQGVAGASLADIAACAGVTRGAIYWHFKNKHELFLAMVERRRLPFQALAERGVNSDEPDPLGRLRTFLVYLLQQAARDQQQRRVFEIMFLKCEFSGENADLLDLQRHACAQSFSRMATTLDNARRRGQLPANLDIQKANTVLHAQLTGLLMNWLFDPAAFPLAEQAEAFVDSSLSMLATAPQLLAR